MSRDKASLLDIVNTAKRVIQFAEGLDKSALATNDEKQSQYLQIIEHSLDFYGTFLWRTTEFLKVKNTKDLGKNSQSDRSCLIYCFT